MNHLSDYELVITVAHFILGTLSLITISFLVGTLFGDEQPTMPVPIVDRIVYKESHPITKIANTVVLDQHYLDTDHDPYLEAMRKDLLRGIALHLEPLVSFKKEVDFHYPYGQKTLLRGDVGVVNLSVT